MYRRILFVLISIVIFVSLLSMSVATTPESPTPTSTETTSYEELVPPSCGYEDKIIEDLQKSGYEPSELSSEIEGDGELRVESDDGEFGVNYDTECSTPVDEPTPPGTPSPTPVLTGEPTPTPRMADSQFDTTSPNQPSTGTQGPPSGPESMLTSITTYYVFLGFVTVTGLSIGGAAWHYFVRDQS